MVIHRGGSYNNAAVGVSPTYRGHAGKDNRSSVGEGFRIAETIAEGTDRSAGKKKTASPNVFETGLAAAQTAERAKRSLAPTKPE